MRAVNRAIYRKLALLGWDVQIVTAKSLPRLANSVQAEPRTADDPTVHYLPLSSSNPRTYLFHGLPELLSDLEPTVVYLEVDPISRLVVETGKWTLRHQIPLSCLSCENLPLNLSAILKREGLSGIRSALFKKLLNVQTRKLVDQVFTISNDGTRVFRELGYSRVNKIPLGFDPSYFRVDSLSRERIREELGLKGITFAYFGRFVPEKGVHLLLDSLASIKDYPWYLMLDQFEGNDSYSQQLQLQVERIGFGDRLRYIHAAHGEVAQYMNAADAVVLPSVSTRKWKEQYGRVAPEAMACGKTVVAFRSGALPELIGDHGLLVEEGNIEKLVLVLSEIASGKVDVNAIGSAAAEYARKNLSIEAQADQMHRVLLSLCSNATKN